MSLPPEKVLSSTLPSGGRARSCVSSKTGKNVFDNVDWPPAEALSDEWSSSTMQQQDKIPRHVPPRCRPAQGTSEDPCNPFFSPSRLPELPDKPHSVSGLRVFKTVAGSPASEIGLEVFFDFVIAINGIKLDEGDGKQVFVKHVHEAENRTAKLTVHNARANVIREAIVRPRKWSGKGLLGATVGYESVHIAQSQGLCVLEVFPNSPAAHAGFTPVNDFVLGTPGPPERFFSCTQDLDQVAKANLERQLQLYVYDCTSEAIRQVTLVPNSKWVANGCIGCELGAGPQHLIPRPQRPPGNPPSAVTCLQPACPSWVFPDEEITSVSSPPTARTETAAHFLASEYRSRSINPPEQQTAARSWSDIWNDVCAENSALLVMEYDTQSQMKCPKCKLCNLWAQEEHLRSQKCVRKREVNGIAIGPQLKQILDSWPDAAQAWQKPMAQESRQYSNKPDAQLKRGSKCANRFCKYLAHSSPGESWPDAAHHFCCLMCYEHTCKGYNNADYHGKKCEAREAPAVPQHMSSDVWQVRVSFVKIQEGIDPNSPALTHHLNLNDICKQISSCFVLIYHAEPGHAETGQWHLRMPLENGGWVTVASRAHPSAPIQTSFHRSDADFETLFKDAEHFDDLLMEARHAWDYFVQCQDLLRHRGAKTSAIDERNLARSRAMQKVHDVLQSRLAAQSSSNSWRSDCGEREQAIKLMHERFDEMQHGATLDLSVEARELEELKKQVKRTRYAAKIAHVQCQHADVEESGIGAESLKVQCGQKMQEARAAAKVYRNRFEHFRRLVNTHAPEEFHRLADCELDFFRSELEQVPPSLKANIVRTFDNQREIADFDSDLSDMKVLSSANACHTVYETSLEGQPCVLKRIDLVKNDGLARLMKEVKFMARLKHSLFTVPVQCAFVEHDSHRILKYGYLQFHRYESDLLQWMQNLQYQPSSRRAEDACRIASAMIHAVSWVHSQNVVHGDLKPANFLWDSKLMLPRLHDFETAMEVQEEEDSCPTGTCTVTLPPRSTWKYEAPEIKTDPFLRRSKKTDAFALGICIEDVNDHLLPAHSLDAEKLRDLRSQLTCNLAADRMSAQWAEERCHELFPCSAPHQWAGNLSDEQLEDHCRDMFNCKGYVEEIVKCRDIRYTQDAISSRFSDGSTFDSLINSIMADETYPLKHESLVLDVVVFKDTRTKPPRIFLHSKDNRRLYCFKCAQQWMRRDLKIKIRKYDFGPVFHKFLGHYDTRSQGRDIHVRGSYRDARSKPPWFA